jgi:hypothetical protein
MPGAERMTEEMIEEMTEGILEGVTEKEMETETERGIVENALLPDLSLPSTHIP